jgi:hypothetical protein
MLHARSNAGKNESNAQTREAQGQRHRDKPDGGHGS